ncbi:MAG: hypothetical protein JSS72_08150 [Armatimonadetes bacterium]|nr:hypothetical protein [Armatimonadota bacterium]
MFLTIFTAAIAASVIQAAPPAESKQFDFWVGEWDAVGESYNVPGKPEFTKTTATNSITRILGGQVVHEDFHSNGLNGNSVSVYTAQTKMWHQTWVDDQGAYLPFQGGMEGKKMILYLVPKRKNRMVFENIGKDAFDWNWQQLSKDGKTWLTAWHLHYTRKK